MERFLKTEEGYFFFNNGRRLDGQYYKGYYTKKCLYH